MWISNRILIFILLIIPLFLSSAPLFLPISKSLSAYKISIYKLFSLFLCSNFLNLFSCFYLAFSFKQHNFSHQVYAINSQFLQILGLRQLFGTEFLWPLLLAITCVPNIISCILLPFCPESPRFLLMDRKQSKDARDGINSVICCLHCSSLSPSQLHFT